MSLLKKIVSSRYFPTVSKPVLSGALTTGAIVAAHALGINVVPAQLQLELAPLAGLLATAIVTKATPSNPDLIGNSVKESGPSVGSMIAGTLVDDLAGVIDQNPDLVRSFTQSVIERATSAGLAPVLQDVTQAVEAPQAAPPVEPSAQQVYPPVVPQL